MSKLKLQQIKDVLRDHDVRDPRGALLAIIAILATKSEVKKGKPVFTLKVFEYSDRAIRIDSKGLQNLQPNHVVAIQHAMIDNVKKRQAASGVEPTGKVEGAEVTLVPLDTFLASLETDDLINKVKQ